MTQGNCKSVEIHPHQNIWNQMLEIRRNDSSKQPNYFTKSLCCFKKYEDKWKQISQLAFWKTIFQISFFLFIYCMHHNKLKPFMCQRTFYLKPIIKLRHVFELTSLSIPALIIDYMHCFLIEYQYMYTVFLLL